MSSRFRHVLPFGAEREADGRVRFRLWAPNARDVQLDRQGEARVALERRDDGWFETIVDCAIEQPYAYAIDGADPVPDPAARAQRDGVNGPSVVVDPLSYAWRNADWRGRPWRETVLYELHVGALGGYDGVRARLPALAELGITAIELMPVAEFPGRRNWGYDGVLPFAPSSAYGRPDQLKALVDEAHALGLMVLLDVVYNHFGPEGNHLGAYASAFFRDDLHTPWGAAIDFRKTEVREYFIHNALYWLEEYRFDGLRLDAVHAISEVDWLDELAQRVREQITDRHVHLVLENEHNDARLLEGGYDAQWNDDFHHAVHVLLTGEKESYYRDFADGPAAALARSLAEGFVYQGEHSVNKNATRGTPSAHLSPTRFVAFLQNHDQIGNRAFGERLGTLANPQAVLAATAILLLAPQIPLLFMGQEWNVRTPFLFFADYRPPLADAVRDGRRNEFANFAAFADEAKQLAIPDPNDPKTLAASIPAIDESAREEMTRFRETVRQLLDVRHREIVPALDATRSLGARAVGDAAVVARWRLDGGVFALYANLGANAVDVESGFDGRVLFATSPDVEREIARGRLPAYGVIARKERA